MVRWNAPPTVTTGPDPTGIGVGVVGAVPNDGKVVSVVGVLSPNPGSVVPAEGGGGVAGAGGGVVVVPPPNEGNVVAVGVGVGDTGAGDGAVGVPSPKVENDVVVPYPYDGKDVYDGDESYQTPPKIPKEVPVS